MILIGVPTMGTIPIKVAASLFSLAKKPDMELIFTRNSLVYDARHTLMQYALENGADLLFIDSDIYFTAEAVERLSSHQKPIVSGLYFQKTEERKPVAYKTVKPRSCFRQKPFVENIDHIEPFMEVAGVGLGFCLIRNEVLRAFNPNRNPFEPFGGLGEDFSFFYRCRKKGYKVFLDTTIPLKHLGEYEYGRG